MLRKQSIGPFQSKHGELQRIGELLDKGDGGHFLIFLNMVTGSYPRRLAIASSPLLRATMSHKYCGLIPMSLAACFWEPASRMKTSSKAYNPSADFHKLSIPAQRLKSALLLSTP